MKGFRAGKRFATRTQGVLIAGIAVVAILGWSSPAPGVAYSANDQVTAGARVGHPVPPFSVPSLTGGQVMLRTIPFDPAPHHRLRQSRRRREERTEGQPG